MVPARHGAGEDRGRKGPAGGHRDGARLGRRDRDRAAEEPVVAGGRGSQLRSHADQPDAARALARLRHHRQQHRREERRGVRDAGDRRRSLPLERGVPDPGASAADQGLERLRRHVDGSVLRADVRAGDGDSVDAAVHRGGRSGGRLLLRLLVRLHRHHQLGVAESAAADDSRSALRLRSAVRRRRDARGTAPSVARRIAASSIRSPRRRRGCATRWARPIARGWRRISTKCARSSAGFSWSKRATPAAWSASCRARRPACPIRSPSTSS